MIREKTSVFVTRLCRCFASASTRQMSLPGYNWPDVQAAIERADYQFAFENAMPHALSGNADAQCTIALLYECGWGVRRDVREAERWLLKATAQNDPVAWNNLGTLYAVKHPELEHRWTEARNRYERAAELSFDCSN